MTVTTGSDATVTYDVAITGRIFENNLKREEKSSVAEQVMADAKGKCQITKTLQGKFWYVQ